jgi:hypothetical protein
MGKSASAANFLIVVDALGFSWSISNYRSHDDYLILFLAQPPDAAFASIAIGK